MKNKLLIFLSIFMLGFSIFALGFKGVAATTDITSLEQWNQLADQATVSGNYRLTTSITITKGLKSFSGTFDGNGYSIVLNGSSGSIANSSGSFGGPFRYVTGTTTIKNLNTRLQKAESADYTGGIIAETSTSSNVTITGCVFNTYYNNLIGSTCAGGIVGYSQGTLTVKNCDVSISSGNAIKGFFVGGIVGKANTTANIIGCSVKGDKITCNTSAVSLGGLVGYSQGADSVLHKNLVKLDNIDVNVSGNGAISYQGAGFLAGHFEGLASGNFAYVKNIVSYTASTAYFVGTCGDYATIFNNVSETNNSAISKEFYSNGPSCAGRNYTAKGLSAIQTSSTSYINPINDSYGSTALTIQFKGSIYFLLNFAINVGCGSVLASGSGERYFNSSLEFKTGTSTDANSYHVSRTYFYYDSNKNSIWNSVFSIQGVTLNLSDFGTPTKSHQTFHSWRNNSGTQITTYAPQSNYDNNGADIIYAAWNNDSKTFYFDVDGQQYKTRSATYNSSMSLSTTSTSTNVPHPTKDGYEFLYWEFVNGTKTYRISNDTITQAQVNELFDAGEVRFNAVFEKNPDTIAVNLNGGSYTNTTFNPVLKKNKYLEFPQEEPHKVGYTFLYYTISNGTKIKAVYAGNKIFESDVNDYIDQGLPVTIEAIYRANVLTINYLNPGEDPKTFGTYNPNGTVTYGDSYNFITEPGYIYLQVVDTLTFVVGDNEYTYSLGKKLNQSIIDELLADGDNTIDVTLNWKSSEYFSSYTYFNSSTVNSKYEVSSDSYMTYMTSKRYNGKNFDTGRVFESGAYFKYTSDSYAMAYIITSEDNTSLNINGVDYESSNGVIQARFKPGENVVVANTTATVVYIGYKKQSMDIDVLCQYDTVNPSDATKIRFIAVINNANPDLIESASFFISVHDQEKEFKVTKLYENINVLDENYSAEDGRYYAVYTLTDIEDAILANTVIDYVKLNVGYNNQIQTKTHLSFTLGQ